MKKYLAKLIPSNIKKSPHFLYKKFYLEYLLGYKYKLKKQLNQKNSPSNIKNGKNKKILVPIFETSHYQHLQILIVAKALQMRGHKIKILVCDEFLNGCEIKSVRNKNISDKCWKCRFHQKNIIPLFGFEVLKLSDLISKNENDGLLIEASSHLSSKDLKLIKYGIDLYQSVNDSVIRYFYGAVPVDKAIVEKVKLNHIHTALLSLETSKKIIEKWKPDIALGNMYTYSTWEPMFKYFRQLGVDYNSLSISQFDYNSILINQFEIYENTERYNQFLNARNKTRLNKSEKYDLKLFFDNRFSGSSTIFKEQKYFSSYSDDEIIEKLKIDKSKRNLFLFSNVYWDVGMSDCSRLYNSILDWVIDTVKIIKNNNNENIHLYLKPHPAEIFDTASSLRSVSQIVKETLKDLPDNFTIIDPASKIKTYDLFQFIDLGIVFNGTLGLEMSWKNIPVVSTGKAPYTGLSIMSEPNSLEEYKDILFGKKQTIKPDKKQLELFNYFYFVKTMLPFNLTHRAYSDNFKGYSFDKLDDLLPGHDAYLDHLCQSIIDSKNTVIEGW